MQKFSYEDASKIILELIKSNGITLPTMGSKYNVNNPAPTSAERNKDLAQTQAAYLKELYDALTTSRTEES